MGPLKSNFFFLITLYHVASPQLCHRHFNNNFKLFLRFAIYLCVRGLVHMCAGSHEPHCACVGQWKACELVSLLQLSGFQDDLRLLGLVAGTFSL